MRRGPILALAGLSWSSAAPAQSPPPAPSADFRILDVLDPCRAARPADEILVCGRRDQSRYRLPRLGDSRAAVGAGNVRGEVPRASADPAASGACGIFQGQRACSEAEMAEFGYGQGRDPITIVGAIIARLADPETDTGPPP